MYKSRIFDLQNNMLHVQQKQMTNGITPACVLSVAHLIYIYSKPSREWIE